MSSPAVLLAVKERLERLRLDLPKAQQATANALQIYDRAVAAQEELKKNISELEQFLAGQGEPVEPTATANSMTMSANNQMLFRARSILADGKPRRTIHLYEEMLQQGQIFTAQNPVQRLSQLLSSSDWFVSDRVHGWSLAKSENPAGTGSSGATKSPTDELGKEGTE